MAMPHSFDLTWIDSNVYQVVTLLTPPSAETTANLVLMALKLFAEVPDQGITYVAYP
jgi:hypothetical protein